MFCSVTDAKDWRGIVPLHSTRADVERLLGVSPHPCKCSYDLGSERITFLYSSEEDPCARGISFLPKVPRDTVLEILVRPKTKLLFSDLRLDKSKYKKGGDHSLAYINYYTNNAEGVLVQVSACDDVVMSINYQPAADDDTPVCTEGNAIFDPAYPSKFDEYGYISFAQEKERLDNFAIYLQSQLDAEGYIVVHAGKRSSINDAQKRAERAKKYVVTKHRIEVSRIVAVGFGDRDEQVVELIFRPRSFLSPYGVVRSLNCPQRRLTSR
jgi:hypothetical protein